MAEYAARRARMGHSADAHWKMATVVREHGLKPEAAAHLTVVTSSIPDASAAWKRLGYKRQGSRWITEEQLAGRKARGRSPDQG